MILSGYENKRARIEILPLIDVVFLLLVFFIYAMMSMVTHKGLRVNLPTASSAHIDKQEFVGISISEANAIHVEKTPVQLNELMGVLNSKRGSSDKHPVFIRADEKSDVGIAISVLDTLRKSGITNISFETGDPRP